LGLPDRDYYFNTDERTKKVREAYPEHLKKMFELSGFDEKKAKDAAADVYAVEFALAKVSRKMEDLRDPFKNYNKTSVKELQEKMNNVPMNEFFHGLGK